MLAAYNIKAVMIHGRTSAQGFAGQLDFAAMKNAREKYRGIILANGGIYSVRDAENVLAETGADGIGIARGALGNPWLFGEAKGRQSEERKKKEVILVALRHARLAEQLKGRQGIIEMRKHLCWYVRGFPGAGNLRQRLVKVLSLAEIKAILQKI